MACRTAGRWANIAAIAIVTVGTFAALDQLHIAPAIVTGLFYALLAVIVGSAIVAIGGGGGGGGIVPMRERWERTLRRYDEEKPRLREQTQGGSRRVAETVPTERAAAPPDGRSPRTGPP